MSRIRKHVVALLLSSLVPASVALANERAIDTALSTDGRLLSLLQGTYGELDADGNLAGDEEPVLALRTTLPDGRQSVQIVPATLDYEREESAGLVVEPASGLTYVFWQSWKTEVHSRFRVASFDGESWSTPIEVSGPSALWRVDPSIAVTSDSYSELTEDAEGGVGRVHRTVLHITWLEEGPDARWNALYAPLVLVDGEYAGEHPVLVLNETFSAASVDHGSELRIAPVLKPRNAGNTVVATFFDPSSAQLMAVEIKFAAGELSILGDAVSAEIGRLGGRNGFGSGSATQTAQAIRNFVLGFGDRVKPEVLGPLASDLESYLRDRLPNGGGDVASIRGDARAQLIDFGFRLTDSDVRRASAVARAQLIDFGARGDTPHQGHRHDARSSVARSQALPEGLTAAPEVLVSSSGKRMLLSWAEPDRVRYRELAADGSWSPMQHIRLTEHFDTSAAMAVLQRRLDQQ